MASCGFVNLSYVFAGSLMLFFQYRRYVKDQAAEAAVKVYKSEIFRKRWANNPREEDRIRFNTWYKTW
jgi:hypothetical protein